MITNFVSGWVSDPARVTESIQSRLAAGHAATTSVFCARQAPTLEGTWQRLQREGIKGVFLRDREKKVTGNYRRPFLQASGTCVSRGMARGVQTSLDYSIADAASLLQAVEVAWAPIYSMARHEIGRDRCGYGDGAILADAARAVHELGVATSDLFRGMDELSIEKLAVQRAAPGVGTPQDWMRAAAGFTCETFWAETFELLCDCLAAGYAVPYAHGYVTGMPDARGMSDLGSYGPHCRCFTGVFLDENGETQLESSESWGEFPAGQPSLNDRTMPIDQMPRITLKYAGGVHVLAPGSVGVRARRFWNEIRNGGEAWAVGAPKYVAKTVV